MHTFLTKLHVGLRIYLLLYILLTFLAGFGQKQACSKMFTFYPQMYKMAAQPPERVHLVIKIHYFIIIIDY